MFSALAHPLAEIPGGKLEKVRQIYCNGIYYILGKHSLVIEKRLCDCLAWTAC